MRGRTGAILVVCLLAGCGQRGTTVVTLKSNSNAAPAAADPAQILAATEFTAQIKAGTLPAAALTPTLKAVVGEPLTPAERERGYSDSSAAEWVKVVGPRLASASVTPLGGGLFVLDGGTLRLVKRDAAWAVDWFHAGRPKGVASITAEDAPKHFAVAAFLDPLFTNNWELSEAALSDNAKRALAPALGADPRGYNRGTLRSKFRSFLNGTTGYLVTVSSDKAVVTLTGAGERKLTLSLSETRPGVWLVNGIE